MTQLKKKKKKALDFSAERKISAGTVDSIRCWFCGTFSCRSTEEKKKRTNECHGRNFPTVCFVFLHATFLYLIKYPKFSLLNFGGDDVFL